MPHGRWAVSDNIIAAAPLSEHDGLDYMHTMKHAGVMTFDMFATRQLLDVGPIAFLPG